MPFFQPLLPVPPGELERLRVPRMVWPPLDQRLRCLSDSIPSILSVFSTVPDTGIGHARNVYTNRDESLRDQEDHLFVSHADPYHSLPRVCQANFGVCESG